MQELAGEFTTCEEIFIHHGHWELIGKTAPNGDRVGALLDYVAWETTDRQGIDAIAEQTFDRWIQTFPYNEQVKFQHKKTPKFTGNWSNVDGAPWSFQDSGFKNYLFLPSQNMLM